MRSKGETAMNLKSSRSHAIFTVFIDKVPTEHKFVLKNKLSFFHPHGVVSWKLINLQNKFVVKQVSKRSLLLWTWLGLNV